MIKSSHKNHSASYDYVIDLVNVSKFFKRQTRSRSDYSTFKSLILKGLSLGSEVSPDSFYALRDLTLRIIPGACVGIIGKNGSGKSTLLKLISGIYRVDSGALQVNGRIAALIELGAGFHPDFTGRENLFLAGVMHGLSRSEVESRFDEIVAFAELENVIDDPVRTYSSGMFMRLGFSLAVHSDPDILIIDEVLAVGDASFVVKCNNKLAELRRNGKTLLFVSHDLEAVLRWCNEVVWLNRGEVADRGDPRRVIDHYRQFVERGEDELLQADAAFRESHSAEVVVDEEGNVAEVEIESEALELGAKLEHRRWGSREVEIERVLIRNQLGESSLVYHPDEGAKIEIHFTLNQEQLPAEAQDKIVFGIGINRSDGAVILGTNTHLEQVLLEDLPSKGVIMIDIDRLGMLSGEYSLDVAAHAEDGYPYDYHQNMLRFAVRDERSRIGIVLPKMSWRVSLA